MNLACLRRAEWGSAFSSMISQWIITGHGKKESENINSLTSKKCSSNFKPLDFRHSFVIDVFSIFYEIFLPLMQRILTDNKSTMVQVKHGAIN